jgi:hypothetical protein
MMVRQRRTPWPTFVALAILWSAALAQPSVAALRVDGTPYYALETVVLALGALSSGDDGSLSVTAATGVLTLFDGAPDGLWRGDGDGGAAEVSFAAPVLQRSGGWYVPADVLDFLGVEAGPEALTLPDGRSLPVAFPPPPLAGEGGGAELEDLGNGVTGLRFFAPGPSGPDDLSLLVIDLSLLPLVFPEQRSALDAVLTELERDRPLYFVLTSLAAAPWEPTFVLSQGERTFEARHPFRVRILDGDPATVAPDAPVIGVILLPEAFRLDAPLGITWGGVASEITFRR